MTCAKSVSHSCIKNKKYYLFTSVRKTRHRENVFFKMTYRHSARLSFDRNGLIRLRTRSVVGRSALCRRRRRSRCWHRRRARYACRVSLQKVNIIYHLYRIRVPLQQCHAQKVIMGFAWWLERRIGFVAIGALLRARETKKKVDVVYRSGFVHILCHSRTHTCDCSDHLQNLCSARTMDSLRCHWCPLL